MDITAKQEMVTQFKKMTDGTDILANQFLILCGWNIEVAVNRFYDNADPAAWLANTGLSADFLETAASNPIRPNYGPVKPRIDFSTKCPNTNWLKIFLFLDGSSFVCLARTCHRLLLLTRITFIPDERCQNPNFKVINHFWRARCLALCTNREITEFRADACTWFDVYKDLKAIFAMNNYDCSAAQNFQCSSHIAINRHGDTDEIDETDERKLQTRQTQVPQVPQVTLRALEPQFGQQTRHMPPPLQASACGCVTVLRAFLEWSGASGAPGATADAGKNEEDGADEVKAGKNAITSDSAVLNVNKRYDCNLGRWERKPFGCGLRLSALFVACKFGHVDVVRYLLGVDGIDINLKSTQFDTTPLLVALDALRVQHEARAPNRGAAFQRPRVGKNTCNFGVHLFAGHEEICKMMIEKIENVEDVNYKDLQGRNALTLAARCGKVELVAQILERFGNKVDLNVRDENGATGLFYGAKNQNVKLIKMMIDSGGDLKNCANKDGTTPLMAVALGHGDNVGVLELLVENGCDVLAKDAKGMTAFSAAASNNNKKIFEYIYNYLVLKEYDTNVIDKYINEVEQETGQTAYIMACKRCDGVAVRSLVSNCKVNVTIRDKNGKRGSLFMFYSQGLQKWLLQQEKNYVVPVHEKPEEPEEPEEEDLEDVEDRCKRWK